jgi:hypothetical protein
VKLGQEGGLGADGDTGEGKSAKTSQTGGAEVEVRNTAGGVKVRGVDG